MVGVHVGEQHRLDVGGIDAGRLDVGQHLAGGGLQVVARAGLDQGEAAGRIDQEGVDGGAARRPEGVGQDLAGLVVVDVAQHLQRAVEEAVADGGDDDVADAAVVDAGDLLLRDVDHALSSRTARLALSRRRRTRWPAWRGDPRTRRTSPTAWAGPVRQASAAKRKSRWPSAQPMAMWPMSGGPAVPGPSASMPVERGRDLEPERRQMALALRFLRAVLLTEPEHDDLHQAVAEGLAPQGCPARSRVGRETAWARRAGYRDTRR